MANAYVGNPYALVFPVDCDGFLKIPYGTHSDITETDLWSHGAGFTVEAVITPYDVNGNGQTGKGKTLEITGPSGSYANGITDSGRYSQKMMLFSNTSFQFYLENQTTGNVNQPAEYRLAAKVGSTTLNSPTVIKPVSTLHGYYDENGFYNGMRTSLTKIDSNASLSLEQGSVEITGNLTSLANDKATGSLTFESLIPSGELYTEGTERTISIEVDNQPTSPNTLDATSSPATGSVDFNTITPPISVLASRDTSKKITIPSTSSTSFNFYFFSNSVGTLNNGVALTHNKFSSGTGFGTFTATTTNGSSFLVASSSLPPALSIGMAISGSGIPNGTTISGINNSSNQITMSSEATATASGVTITFGSTDYTSSDIAVIPSANTAVGFAAALHAAVNKVNTDNSSFSISSVYLIGGDEIALNSDTNNSSFNEDITKGSSVSSDINISGLSGGVTSSTNINEYLTITIKTGSSSTVARNFKYYPSSNSYTSGDTTTTENDTTVYRVEVGSDTDDTASNLKTAINAAFNTTTEASASVSNSIVTVNQKYVGANFGSGSSVAETNAYSAGGLNSLHTIGSHGSSGFTSGTQASDTTYSKFIKIGSNYFSPCDSVSLAGTNKTITDSSSTVTSRLFRADSSVANTVNDIVTRINTDVSSNGSSIITGSNTSTGEISFELNDFTAALTLTKNLTNVTETGISGGQELTAFISITDAAGVERKYKPAVDENTATSDGTYVFFQASADTAATAAQLELAIESANGHNGSLTVSRINSTMTLTVTTTGTNETMSLDNTNITSSNVTLTAFAGAPNVVTVSQSQTGLLGAGNKIYDSSGTFIDTVASVNGTQITLSNAQSSITSTIYKEQPKEALYVNNLYKVSCVLEKSGKLKLFFNNTLVAETAISSFTFDMANADCFIGQDGTNVSTQFMGELYEIGMKKGVQPSASIHTLEAGYSDIIFYYRFGDE